MDSCSLDTPGLWNYLIRNHHFSLMENISVVSLEHCLVFTINFLFSLATLTFDKFCFNLLVYTFFPFGYKFCFNVEVECWRKTIYKKNFLGC